MAVIATKWQHWHGGAGAESDARTQETRKDESHVGSDLWMLYVVGCVDYCLRSIAGFGFYSRTCDVTVAESRYTPEDHSLEHAPHHP
jgi:hypothetical protein